MKYIKLESYYNSDTDWAIWKWDVENKKAMVLKSVYIDTIGKEMDVSEYHVLYNKERKFKLTELTEEAVMLECL